MSGPSERTVPRTDADERTKAPDPRASLRDAATIEGGVVPEGAETPKSATIPEGAETPRSATIPEGAETPRSAIPEGAETPERAAPPAEPGFLERGRVRRRARYLRRLREVQLRDIGGFMLELHRFGREQPALVQAKLAGAASTDMELRALERALRDDQPLRELREAGIGGACTRCRAVHGSSDHYCASCGEPLTRRASPEAEPVERGETAR